MILAASLSLTLAEPNSTMTNSTTKPEMIGWVSPDARRSTWDILWSCLSIFLVCSWKCVHLNLPTLEESRGEWHKVSLWRWKMPYWPMRPLSRKWGRKLMWMGIISIAPEMGVALALKQRLEAQKTLEKARTSFNAKKLNKKGIYVEYSMAHAFYIKMGGITLRYFREEDILREVSSQPDTQVLVDEHKLPDDTENKTFSSESGASIVECFNDELGKELHWIFPGIF
jgi:hypothetical protein